MIATWVVYGANAPSGARRFRDEALARVYAARLVRRGQPCAYIDRRSDRGTIEPFVTVYAGGRTRRDA